MDRQAYLDAKRLRMEYVLLGAAIANRTVGRKVCESVTQTNFLSKRNAECLDAVEKNDSATVRSWVESLGVTIQPEDESVIDSLIREVVQRSDKQRLYASLASVLALDPTMGMEQMRDVLADAVDMIDQWNAGAKA